MYLTVFVMNIISTNVYEKRFWHLKLIYYIIGSKKVNVLTWTLLKASAKMEKGLNLQNVFIITLCCLLQSQLDQLYNSSSPTLGKELWRWLLKNGQFYYLINLFTHKYLPAEGAIIHIIILSSSGMWKKGIKSLSLTVSVKCRVTKPPSPSPAAMTE